tara:strand:- start:114 stop:323 length:210 start_codon:yes stop_codon:yes gene_type:complete
MDQIDVLMEKFFAKTNSHPELANLWILYLTHKKARLGELVAQGERTLELMETTDDIPINDIILLCLLPR